MVALFLLLFPLLAIAQTTTSPPSSQSPTSSPSPSLSLSLSLTTSTATVTLATSRQGQQPSQFTTVLPVVSNVTFTITPPAPSSSTTEVASSASASVTPSPSATPDPLVLATKVDPAFGVLGVILILTGLPSAFWGHKNRWTSFFLIGFYTLSLVCIVLILKFGVLPAINPPSQTVRGLFLLASTIAGVVGGAIAIFFWKGARYGIGAWGGFAVGLWIQCFRDGGLIRTIGFRWILYIGCGVVGFALSTIPKIHYHVLLASTAFVGATSFMLGVDCFTTAGLKEFYIWNLGFPSLFPRYVERGIQFPVSQTMQIELGLTGAVALMGVAVQLRILKVLQKKMAEIAEETKRRDEEEEGHAAARIGGSIERERSEWEKEHPTLTKHGRQDSNFSITPLMKDREDSGSPSSHLLDDVRPRYLSNVSDFKTAPASDDELKRASRAKQVPGALPQLDLGMGIQEDVPATFIADDDVARRVEVSAAELQDFKRKQALLQEIQTIRKSIEVLKSETPIPSSSEHSRRPSFASKRTLSIDATSALLPPSHSRPPREMAPPRGRVRSMELSSLANTLSEEDPISRPTSVPLKDTDWDSYIQERRLLQPPSGVSAPIGTSVSPRAPLSPAVQEALQMRKHRENAIAASSGSSEDIPLARLAAQPKQHSPTHTHNSPVTILPPRRQSTSIVAPVPVAAPRTHTFEELNERHREKMRGIQAPLTQAQKEHAELEAARQRWERSKALEKEAVTRRQAEKAAALEKRRKSAILDEGQQGKGGNRASPTEAHARRRSLSVDKLGNPGTSSSRRLSTLKVEDWQRYQQDAEMGAKPEHGTGSKREARGTRPGEGVPFPNEAGKRRKSRDFLS